MGMPLLLPLPESPVRSLSTASEDTMAKNKKIAVAQPVVVEATDTPVEAPAPAPATTMAKLKAKSAELKLTKTGMPALPKMPRVRKPKPAQDCACGCGNQTKGGRFIPGHEIGRAHV